MIEVADVRAARRVEPRVGVAVAGAGIVIAVGGALGLAGDQTGAADDPNRFPGIVVSIALVAAGVTLVRRFRTGALALAGSVAAAVGVPALVVFATLDDGEFPGFDLAPTLLVAALGWAALDVVCDRRLLFLAAALVALPAFVMEATEEISNVPELIGYGFSSAFYGVDEDRSTNEFYDGDGDGWDDVSGLSERDHEEYLEYMASFDDDRPQPPETPDATVLGVIAVAFAALYVVTGRALSDRGSLGAGTPPTVVGAVLAALGVALLAADLEEVGSGFALVGIGGALVWIGVAGARRFTTWWGAALVGVGITVLLSEVLDDVDTTASTMVVLVIGAAVVLLGHVIGDALDELPEEGVDALPALVASGGDGDDEALPFEVPLDDDE